MTKKYFLDYRAIIISDLNLAFKGANSGVKSDKTLGAYHMQQAIEKTIKLKAELKGLNLWGHNIMFLIRECEKYNLDIGVPSLIKKNALMYTNWEAGCRYMPLRVVNKNSILAAYRECLNWLNSGDTAIK